MNKLTHQEESVMLIIWQKGSGIIKDFLNEMADPRPPYTTVASIVRNLQAKAYLSAKRVGNTYWYMPVISEEEYKRFFMKGVVSNYFENSYKELVTFFAHEQKISAKELKEIINLIENPEK